MKSKQGDLASHASGQTASFLNAAGETDRSTREQAPKQKPDKNIKVMDQTFSRKSSGERTPGFSNSFKLLQPVPT
jgi:hypothetical protein